VRSERKAIEMVDRNVWCEAMVIRRNCRVMAISVCALPEQAAQNDLTLIIPNGYCSQEL
jgi:hypothetical protein